MCVCLYSHYLDVWCQWRLEEGMASSQLELGGCEPQCGFWKLPWISGRTANAFLNGGDISPALVCLILETGFRTVVQTCLEIMAVLQPQSLEYWTGIRSVSHCTQFTLYN